MLTISVPERDFWDDSSQKFIHVPSLSLRLEHSLLSISKWEEKWHVPLLYDKTEMTADMFLDYVRCMTITKNVPAFVYAGLTQENFQTITNYIKDPHTATWFGDDKRKRQQSSKRIVTSELVYYWMTQYNIPFSCEKWNINRLITLIRVEQEEAKAQEKESKRTTYSKHASLNKARRAARAARKS